MSDVPQRANAAQLAARNIKMRPQRKKPLAAPPGAPQQQSFAPPSQNGLLFGGMQGPSDFNFSAGGPSISFSSQFGTPNNSFTSNTGNSFGSNASGSDSDDPRADNNEEEMKRRNRIPTFLDKPDDNEVPMFAPMPAEIAQNGPAVFGAGVQQASSSFSFGQSNAQPATSNIFNSTSNAQSPSSFSFGSTSTQPAATPNNPFASASSSFGSTPAQPAAPQSNIFAGFGQPAAQPAQPTNSGFSFGQQASAAQPPASTPAFSFGQSAPAPATEPAKTSFSFGQSSTPSTQPTSTFSFGSTTTSSPAPANNLFGASPAQPSSNLFGSTNTVKEPSPSLFGNSASPAPATTNIFGSKSQSPAPESQPSSNLFGSTNTAKEPSPSLFGNPASPAPATTNIFGSKSQSPAPETSNLFGSHTVTAPSTNNLFGNSTPQPASTSNLFGAASSAATTTSNNTSTLFGGSNSTPAPLAASSNPFGQSTQQAAPTSNLFGGNKESTPSNSLFGHLNQPVNQQVQNAPSLFDKPKPSSDVRDFAQVPPPAVVGSTSVSEASSVKSSTPAPLFGSSSKSFGNGTKPVSPMKSIDAPSTASQPPPTGMFPSLTPSKSQPTPNANTAAFKPATNDNRQLASSSNNVLQSIEPKEVVDSLATPNPTSALDITNEYIDRFMPKGYTQSQKAQFYSCYRMRALNKAMEKLFARMPIGMEITGIVDYYNDQREQIMSQSGRPFKSSKRKVVEEEQESSSNKRVRQGEPLSRPQVAAPETSPEKVGRITSSQNNVGSSSLFTSQSLAAPQPTAPLFSPTKNQLLPNGSTTPKAPAPSFGNPPASASPSKGKRKAEYQISDRDPEGKGGERQIKTPKLNGSVGSETSNIFKNILDSPSKTPKSPEKSKGRLETLEKASQEAPRNNPFASLAAPGSPAKSALQSQPSTSYTTSSALQVIPSYTTTSSALQVTPSPAKPAATPIKPPTFGVKPPTFGTGPVNFLAQFGQQAKKDEKDNEEKLMEKAKEEDMDSDDDEAEWEANYKQKRQAELKELEELAKSKRASFVVGQGFTFGDSSKPLSPAASADASRTKSIFSSTTTAPTAPKALFGQAPTPTSSESIFSSANGSRSSTPGGSVLDSHTPGKAVSFSGNIFGHLSNPGSPANGTNDDDSDADGESDSENKDPTYQPGEPGSDAASGPTTPVEKTGSGIASAKKAASTTPFSFGSAAQPAKSLFGQSTTSSSVLFGTATTSSSGTSSPGGSLFDRISKDSNGNPIRQVPSEEKENTQPNVTNIFGSSNGALGSSSNSAGVSNASSGDASQSTPTKALFGQTDKTWKPDSPIRFGSATPNGTSTSAPTVSLTDATPTKPNPFAGLFGNSTSKPASPASGSLFGNSTTSKATPSATPGVGFAFGGPSSTTSSLFPSAAVSASTSRATSPGQTTDGDSAAEGSNDPDAEKHEQIDLTKGGPGEEDEQLLHEVRAKALKYSPSDDEGKSPWVTKGLGPLRILKHKETKAARVLLRADPSGTIVLNKGILAGVDFTANGKTLKFLAASDSGSGLETWMLQVKTPEFATELAKVLEANKSSS